MLQLQIYLDYLIMSTCKLKCVFLKYCCGIEVCWVPNPNLCACYDICVCLFLYLHVTSLINIILNIIKGNSTNIRYRKHPAHTGLWDSKVFIWPLFTFSQIAYNKQLHKFLIYMVKKTSIMTTSGRGPYMYDISHRDNVMHLVYPHYLCSLHLYLLTTLTADPTCPIPPTFTCMFWSVDCGDSVRIISLSLRSPTTNQVYSLTQLTN